MYLQFGFDFDRSQMKLDWGALKKRRDAYVQRLNGIYDRMLAGSKVNIIRGEAKFSAPNAVSVADKGTCNTIYIQYIHTCIESYTHPIYIHRPIREEVSIYLTLLLW